ncbi:hypothetical protein Fcan01_02330 [Folsomia candida]|uniref:Uncharacterized protein n=1 Tax=Folsomia candida TaxID=158441 RepID=A0A226EZ51_FOLCA|nr:hypothetical protein Fcan01_02330 [Folsomia candida]
MATTFAVNLLHPSILNFQSCILTESLVKELECKNGEEFFETFVSIGLSSRGSRVLGRCCKSRLLDGFSLIQCDSRVEELMFSSNNAHDEEADGKYGKVCWEELELARHLGWRLKMNGSKANSGFDVDEDEPESSVRFNDALCCTSKDIRMLKSSTIKKMRLTVISDAPLSDFLYETNHKMTSRTTEEKSSSFSMTKTFHQQEGEETTAEGMSKFHTPSATGTFCTWKLLREKIRQIFQSYEIHVRSNVLVDLRGCPLAGKKGSLGCPSFSFVFVEECNFRGEEEDAENDIGKVASKTEILINHVHHISHYKRQEEVATTTESGPAHNEDQVFGVENAQKVLTSLIEMQQRNKSESDSENGKCFPLMNNFHSHGLLIGK